jgi:hypothetical protein
MSKTLTPAIVVMRSKSGKVDTATISVSTEAHDEFQIAWVHLMEG